jgi:hypothetical protein
VHNTRSLFGKLATNGAARCQRKPSQRARKNGSTSNKRDLALRQRSITRMFERGRGVSLCRAGPSEGTRSVACRPTSTSGPGRQRKASRRSSKPTRSRG